MENEIAYCFVVDKNSRPLAPTKVNKGWYLVRKGRAKIKSRYPMVIQLEKEVEYDKYDESRMIVGIDDGSAHVGLAIVQKCPTKTKWFLKERLSNARM